MPPRKKLVVKLSISSARLTTFERANNPEERSSPEPSSNPIVSTAPSPSNAPAQSQNATPIPNEPPNANTPAAASDSTPAPSSLIVPGKKDGRKGVPGPKPGGKRAAAQALEIGQQKVRGKPGPKKKPRPGEPGGDPSPFSGPTPLNVPKLGPKANMGAINAGLRALDRSGRPTRKWSRQALNLKSFTGMAWSIPTWRAPKKAVVPAPGDVTQVKTEQGGVVSVGPDSAPDMARVVSEAGTGDGDITMADVPQAA